MARVVLGQQRLMEAVANGDQAAVLRLIDQGLDMNGRDVSGGWPLLAAVERQDVALARLLVDHGARPVSFPQARRRRRKRTELHALAEAQRGPFSPSPGDGGWMSDIIATMTRAPSTSIQLWKLLLDAGSSASASDKAGATPFHLACANGNLPVVQFLLQPGKHVVRGYNLEWRDDRRRTPLHYAASHGHASVVALLLDHGANALAVSDDGDGSQLAREAGHDDVAEMLKRYAETACPLLCMPVEVLLCVMEKLEPYDLCNVAQTCTAINQVSSADCLWHRFCDAKWPQVEDASWKSRYLKWLQARLHRFAVRQRNATAVEPPNTPRGCSKDTYKLILCGEAGVGKTALFNRFIYDEFHSYPVSMCHDFQVKRLTINGQPVILQLWDTAGQERRWSMSKHYYRGAAGALMTYDITNVRSFHQVKLWVEQLVQANGTIGSEPPPMILVGTKSDLEERRAVTAAEGQALALELGAEWIETSSLTGSRVDEAFECLAASVMLGEFHPAASYVYNGGCHVPAHELLCRIFSNSTRSTSPPSCILQ